VDRVDAATGHPAQAEADTGRAQPERGHGTERQAQWRPTAGPLRPQRPGAICAVRNQVPPPEPHDRRAPAHSVAAFGAAANNSTTAGRHDEKGLCLQGGSPGSMGASCPTPGLPQPTLSTTKAVAYGGRSGGSLTPSRQRRARIWNGAQRSGGPQCRRTQRHSRTAEGGTGTLVNSLGTLARASCPPED
jgi:hypothetical protein